MGTLKRGSTAVALGGLLVLGLVAFAQLPASGAGANVALAQGSPPGFYNVATGELTIPDGAAGFLQADAICSTGDVAVGGGHIVHPSSTTGMFVTKSYPTDSTGDFTPPYIADRWRVKVAHPADLTGGPTEKLTVHVVCADITPPFGP